VITHIFHTSCDVDCTLIPEHKYVLQIIAAWLNGLWNILAFVFLKLYVRQYC
jgi:hypothetical protein